MCIGMGMCALAGDCCPLSILLWLKCKYTFFFSSMCAKTVVFLLCYCLGREWRDASDDGAHIKTDAKHMYLLLLLRCCSCIKLYNKHGNVLQKQSMWYLSTLLYAGMQFDIFFHRLFLQCTHTKKKIAAYSSLLFHALFLEYDEKEKKKETNWTNFFRCLLAVHIARQSMSLKAPTNNAHTQIEMFRCTTDSIDCN